MHPITIEIPHSHGKEEAKRRIELGFGKIKQQMIGGVGVMFQLEEAWEADRLVLRGSGLGQQMQGHIDCLDDRLIIQIELPAVLAVAASTIADKVKRQSQLLLEE